MNWHGKKLVVPFKSEIVKGELSRENYEAPAAGLCVGEISSIIIGESRSMPLASTCELLSFRYHRLHKDVDCVHFPG